MERKMYKNLKTEISKNYKYLYMMSFPINSGRTINDNTNLYLNFFSDYNIDKEKEEITYADVARAILYNYIDLSISPERFYVENFGLLPNLFNNIINPATIFYNAGGNVLEKIKVVQTAIGSIDNWGNPTIALDIYAITNEDDFITTKSNLNINNFNYISATDSIPFNYYKINLYD